MEAPSSPACQTMLGACSPAPTGLGALNSRQQHRLTSWGKLWGKNNVQELTVEGLRRETKGLRGSEEGGVRHDCLLDWGRPGGSPTRVPRPPASLLAGILSPCRLLPPAHLVLAEGARRPWKLGLLAEWCCLPPKAAPWSRSAAVPEVHGGMVEGREQRLLGRAFI